MDNRHVYQFSYFQLDPAQKILLHDGHRVPLDPKTFLILLALVEAEGHVISKDELMAKVWHDAYVEENNLTKNISRLRKALGNGDKSANFIETIPKVGYRFSAEISLAPAANGSANNTIAVEAVRTREAEVKGTDNDSRQRSVRRDYNYPPHPWYPR